MDLTDKYQAEGLGQVINSLTGRGSLGQAESAGKVFNIVFFSPKLFKANIDKLFMPFYGKEKISKQARKEASRSTLGIIL